MLFHKELLLDNLSNTSSKLSSRSNRQTNTLTIGLRTNDIYDLQKNLNPYSKEKQKISYCQSNDKLSLLDVTSNKEKSKKFIKWSSEEVN